MKKPKGPAKPASKGKPSRIARSKSGKKPIPAKPTIIPRLDGRAGKPNDVAWHDRFLQSLRANFNVTTACDLAGVNRDVAYDHREKFASFAEEWERARKAGRKMRADAVEDGFLDRIQNGVPAFTGSGAPILDPKTKVQCREFQDTVVLKALAAIMPDVYSEKRRVELSGKLTMSDEEIAEASVDTEKSLLLTLAGGLKGAKP